MLALSRASVLAVGIARPAVGGLVEARAAGANSTGVRMFSLAKMALRSFALDSAG